MLSFQHQIFWNSKCYYFKIIENLVFHLFTHIFFGNHHLAVIFQWSKTSYSCLVGIFPWSCISPIEWEFPLNNAFFPKKRLSFKILSSKVSKLQWNGYMFHMREMEGGEGSWEQTFLGYLGLPNELHKKI